MTYTQEDMDHYHARIDKLQQRIDQLEICAGEREGHGELCYYCENPCNALAGDPSQWPIPMSHAGVVKWHHIGCVSQRSDSADKLKLSLKKILKHIETGVLVRDISKDNDAGWALPVMRLVVDLKEATEAVQ